MFDKIKVVDAHSTKRDENGKAKATQTVTQGTIDRRSTRTSDVTNCKAGTLDGLSLDLF